MRAAARRSPGAAGDQALPVRHGCRSEDRRRGRGGGCWYGTSTGARTAGGGRRPWTTWCRGRRAVQDTWLNTVASCAEDNHRKADRTPEQAGMPLLRKPFVPTPADAHAAGAAGWGRGRRCRSGWRSPGARASGAGAARHGLRARLRRGVRWRTCQRSSSWTIARMPTATMIRRSAVGGSRRPTMAPNWPPSAEPTAIRRTAVQSKSATKRKKSGGDAVDHRAEDVLHGVDALEVVVEQQPHQGEVDDALRGAEVAAVDAGEQQTGEQQRAAVGAVRCHRAPRGGAWTRRASRGWRMTRTKASADQDGDDRVEGRGGKREQQDRSSERRRASGDAAEAEDAAALAGAVHVR